MKRLLVHFDGASGVEALPESVKLWLADKYKLCGMPFRYLVPEEAMLPPESIRFFYVEREWLDAMTDGALSIGRQTEIDRAMDAETAPLVKAQAAAQIPARRYQLMHANHRRGMPGEMDADAVMCGFFLRSCLARIWKGIEVRGYEGEEERTIVRMEMIDVEFILCLFDGGIDRIMLYEPTEDLHFGIKDGKVKLRRITGDVGKFTGGEVAETLNAKRRLDVLKLVKDVGAALGEGGGAAQIHSAELALQLLTVADRCEIKNGGKR